MNKLCFLTIPYNTYNDRCLTVSALTDALAHDKLKWLVGEKEYKRHRWGCSLNSIRTLKLRFGDEEGYITHTDPALERDELYRFVPFKSRHYKIWKALDEFHHSYLVHAVIYKRVTDDGIISQTHAYTVKAISPERAVEMVKTQYKGNVIVFECERSAKVSLLEQTHNEECFVDIFGQFITKLADTQPATYCRCVKSQNS